MLADQKLCSVIIWGYIQCMHSKHSELVCGKFDPCIPKLYREHTTSRQQYPLYPRSWGSVVCVYVCVDVSVHIWMIAEKSVKRNTQVQ